MNVLVLGVSGMLGSAMFRRLPDSSALSVFGTVRSVGAQAHFSEELRSKIVVGVDVESQDSLVAVFGRVQPDVVGNWVGLGKEPVDANDPLPTVPSDSLLRPRLGAI